MSHLGAARHQSGRAAGSGSCSKLLPDKPGMLHSVRGQAQAKPELPQTHLGLRARLRGAGRVSSGAELQRALAQLSSTARSAGDAAHTQGSVPSTPGGFQRAAPADAEPWTLRWEHR